uniref:Uncharacterized protein n=1 Tax=Rhizochromulina marina TaxID=1034831 RepID=A0A7S2RE23_9STRA
MTTTVSALSSSTRPQLATRGPSQEPLVSVSPVCVLVPPATMLRTLLVVSLLCVGANGQAWTRKKKAQVRPQSEETPEPDPSVYGNFARMNELAAGMHENGGLDMAEMMKALESFGEQDLTQVLSEGMGMWKDMLDSPEVQQMLGDPEQMRAAMLPFVEAFGGDVSKLDEALQDPTKLKESMVQGIDAMQELFSSPEKMQELAAEFMNNLDPATKGQLERLGSGDMSAITEALGDIVGGEQQMQELAEMLNNPEKLNQMASELLGEGNSDLAQGLQDLLAQSQGASAAGSVNLPNFKERSRSQ